MTLYKVFQPDEPWRYVLVDVEEYGSMRIKEKAIESSTIFGWADYASLKIRRLKT